MSLLSSVLTAYTACASLCPAREYVLHDCVADLRPVVCAPCPAGFFCNGSTKLPVACARGAWSFPHSAECTRCTQCTRGAEFEARECAGITDTVCVACPSGYNCRNTSNPFPCPSNTFATADGTRCEKCPPAHVSPPASSSALACACEHGGGALSDKCTPCAERDLVSNGVCIACPDGFECKDRTPRLCPKNTYSRNGTCEPCPAFSRSVKIVSGGGAWSLDHCVCQPGYVKSMSQQCVPCHGGTYYDPVTQHCRDCESGYFCVGELHRQRCPPNAFSSARSTACTTCPINSVCENCTDARHCVCGAGFERRHASDTDTTTPRAHDRLCVPCQPGQYNSVANSTCAACPAGHFCTGHDHVQVCALGTFSAAASSQCRPCATCPQLLLQRCNSTDDSVCVNASEAMANIYIEQHYLFGDTLAMTKGAFMRFALVLSSMLPQSSVSAVCVDPRNCMRCFQGMCEEDIDGANTTATAEGGSRLPLKSRHFLLRLLLHCYVNHIQENVEGLRGEAFMRSVSHEALRQVMYPGPHSVAAAGDIATTSRNEFASAIDDYKLQTVVSYDVTCPDPNAMWNGTDCEVQAPSQRAVVAKFLFLLTFIAMATGVLLYRRKASYKLVSQQM